MLEPIPLLNAQLITMNPTIITPQGLLDFVDVIGDFMDKIQAGPTGSPGILVFNRPAMFGAMVGSSVPTITNIWVPMMAAAWATAMTASVIVPGTVMDPTWTASAVDVVTAPIGGGTIINIPAAQAALQSKLYLVNGITMPAIPMATAFYTAASMLKFNCIGLMVAGLVVVPVPVIKSAL